MGRRRQRGRPISGIILVDKPQGLTSNQVLQQVKRLFGAAKAGHTGSLDPLATGVLPICLGEATKYSQYLLDADKGYRTTATLGAKTTTGDAEGEIIEEKPVAHITEADIDKVLPQFMGEIQQVPSMYSAIKVDGQPLYKLARQGVEIERKARTVRIYSLKKLQYQASELKLEVLCSKGTYIRSLVEDIGEQLGCGGYVSELRRFSAGPYDEEQLYTFEQLQQVRDDGGHQALDELLLPVDTAVMHWPEILLTETTGFYVQQGQPVTVSKAPTSGWVRLYLGEQRQFIGIGEIDDEGRVAPRRLIKTKVENTAG
ncbi:tRNA pseudouridine(55) synthase TruB [Spartinivicinus poritis]|uniref:tRNA pseudouridine synthase B n=1 Tax=Spartinivicinus poritis TaxID=2994640 RepID=A0ABT5UDT5_9GAMM|nr:tRNA pseudouridine(55) synthase TruB [Spartinivicinus sp. A2-2]MDE1463259.1 tRNA pseudouridine(55) synthase TruB [Spartinivicinus sp. A2-2]